MFMNIWKCKENIKKTNIAGKLINANENQKYIQDSIL